MYSYNDFERLFLRYKLEGLPSGVSIEKFCMFHKVPYNLFEKWYKDTRHKVVEVNISGRPSLSETDNAKDSVPQEAKEPSPKMRILVDLRVSNGLRLRQGNLSYGQLKRLVEKQEGLC